MLEVNVDVKLEGLLSLLWTGVEHHGDGLGPVDLPELELDVLQEVMVAGVEANLSHGLAQTPHCQGLLSPLGDLDGFEAGVDQLGHVLRLEVLLRLVGVHDEVSAAVVPKDGALVAGEEGVLVGLLLLLVHQVEGVGEGLGLDLVRLTLHFLQIILVGVLRSTISDTN